MSNTSVNKSKCLFQSMQRKTWTICVILSTCDVIVKKYEIAPNVWLFLRDLNGLHIKCLLGKCMSFTTNHWNIDMKTYKIFLSTSIFLIQNKWKERKWFGKKWNIKPLIYFLTNLYFWLDPPLLSDISSMILSQNYHKQILHTGDTNSLDQCGK